MPKPTLKHTPTLSHGVKVAQEILVLSVQVRILVGQQPNPVNQSFTGFFLYRGTVEGTVKGNLTGFNRFLVTIDFIDNTNKNHLL